MLRASADVGTTFVQLARARERLSHMQVQQALVERQLQSARRAFQVGAACRDDLLGAEADTMRVATEHRVDGRVGECTSAEGDADHGMHRAATRWVNPENGENFNDHKHFM